jgi:hypothetical protein
VGPCTLKYGARGSMEAYAWSAGEAVTRWMALLTGGSRKPVTKSTGQNWLHRPQYACNSMLGMRGLAALFRGGTLVSSVTLCTLKPVVSEVTIYYTVTEQKPGRSSGTQSSGRADQGFRGCEIIQVGEGRRGGDKQATCWFRILTRYGNNCKYERTLMSM